MTECCRIVSALVVFFNMEGKLCFLTNFPYTVRKSDYC